MNPQPTIFISSIISEFYDLRGALKYFLGKNGFRVLMSEEQDFGADCSLDSLDNCKLQIEKSDYYLLIIGNKSGYTFNFNGEKTSVTLEEFRHYLYLKTDGKPLNFIAFLRRQTWDAYKQKDISVIDEIQIKFIDELLNHSLFEDLKIGRWRYTFDKFSDIVAVLETNQNGLFLESTRKTTLYRTYIEREIKDIIKNLLTKNDEGELTSLTDYLHLPKLDYLDILNYSRIPKEIAVNIVVFIVMIASKDTLMRKINRVFNYVAQGEFSYFDPEYEKYVLPYYIRSVIQALEILERVFDNSKNVDLFEQIRNRSTDNFTINKAEYSFVKSAHTNISIAISQLQTLIYMFDNKMNDLQPQPEINFSYRGGLTNDISEQELSEYIVAHFAKFKKK